MFEAQEPIEVKLPDGRRFEAMIRHVDHQSLLVLCRQEDAARLRPELPIRITQTVGTGVYQIETHVQCCHPQGFIASRGMPEKMQRRSARRIDCSLDAWYRLGGGQMHRPGMEISAALEPGHIRDLSMGGAKMAVGSPLPAGAVLWLEIALDSAERLKIEGTIIRCTTLKTPWKRAGGALGFEAAIRFGPLSRLIQGQLQQLLLQQARRLHPSSAEPAAEENRA